MWTLVKVGVRGRGRWPPDSIIFHKRNEDYHQTGPTSPDGSPGFHHIFVPSLLDNLDGPVLLLVRRSRRPPQQDPDLLPRIDLKASPDPWFFPAESADQWLSGSYGSKPAPEPSKKSCGETPFRSPRQQGRGRAVRETGGWNSRRNNLAPTLFLLFPLWSLFPAGVKAKDVQSQQSDFGIYGYRKQRAGKGALSAKLGI